MVFSLISLAGVAVDHPVLNVLDGVVKVSNLFLPESFQIREVLRSTDCAFVRYQFFAADVVHGHVAVI